MVKKNSKKLDKDGLYRKETDIEKFVRKLLIKEIQNISNDPLLYLPSDTDAVHTKRIATSLVDLKETFIKLDKYVKEQANPTLGIELYTIAFNFFLNGVILAKYGEPLELIEKLSKGRKLNEDRQKDKDIERFNRRQIISNNFKGKYAVSNATAKEIIRKCEDKFKEAGINSYGITTIKDDIRFLKLEKTKV